MSPVGPDRTVISVIVPAFNAERFLPMTLDSIRGQSEKRWECIVVDDGSSDATADIADCYARDDSRIRVVRKANGGASSARNTGYRASDRGSSFVTFMDADDVYLPHALTTLLAAAESDSTGVGSHGLADLIDQGGRPIAPGEYAAKGRRRLGLEGRRLRVWPLDRPTDFRVLVNGNVLFPPGLVLARRHAYDAVGPFDQQFNGPEDWDMLIRLSRMGHLTFVDDVILLYRRHGSNLGAQPGIERQAWMVRCKAFHSPDNSPEQREIARVGWRAYQRDMAIERYRSARIAISNRRPAAAVKELGRLAVSCGRYARGYPRPRLVRGSPNW